MKKELVASLRETPSLLSYKNEMTRKHINIIYVYKDNNGTEIAKIKITPTDIFQD